MCTKCIDKECVIVALYIDDKLIFGTSLDIVYSTERFLASQFDMKDMGEAKVMLSVKITRIGDSIMIYKNIMLRRYSRGLDISMPNL